MFQFEWDELKNTMNYAKHGVDFYDAQDAFFDPRRVIAMILNTAKPSQDSFAMAG